MYKVFIYNKPIFLTESEDEIEETHGIPKEYCLNRKDAKIILEGLKKNPRALVIIGNDAKKLFEMFFSDFIILKAAGGVVLNQKNEILFIFRNGFWDLPKGKIEKGEKKKIAAVREVEEECGIDKPVIKKKLLTTYHTYELKGKRVLKPTYWYLMKYEGEAQLAPQIEEGITEVQWVNPSAMKEQMAQTYDAIKDVVNEYLKQ